MVNVALFELDEEVVAFILELDVFTLEEELVVTFTLDDVVDTLLLLIEVTSVVFVLEAAVTLTVTGGKAPDGDP